ncbi:uncharacterized protein LOC119616626 [Kryptolebias marmoratus]|uniref:uncharacterized protein LOC119616626 n=1 Tax=Kryptolebias marmoratus TaxID=37003 RepID=UPI0018ACC84C|nr:uncharacterized protein LOC119616626 [Kryptolebias marmoratus]
MNHSSLPNIQPHVFQQSGHNQYTPAGFHKQSQVKYLLNSTALLPSTSMMSRQTSLPPMSSYFQTYEEMLNYMQYYYDPAHFVIEGTQAWSPVAMSSTQPRYPPPNTLELQADSREVLIGPQSSRTAALPEQENSQWKNVPPVKPGTGCNMAVTGEETEKGDCGAFRHSIQKPPEDAIKKRQLRLMKNREAARECRQRKKEYVKCLESRVEVLETQNKTLIEELRTLKNIYQHKAD